MTVETMQPSALMLPSMDYDLSTFEGASILGSLRGSREFGTTPRDLLNLNTPREGLATSSSAWGSEGAEDLMSAPSFFLTSLAAGATATTASTSMALVGSRDTLHGLGTRSTDAGETADSVSMELPVFPRRTSARSINVRGLSVSRSHDAWGGGMGRGSLSSPSFGDLLLLPPISRSSEGKTRNFLDLIDGTAANAASAANAAPASAVVEEAHVVATVVGKHQGDQSEDQESDTTVPAEVERHQCDQNDGQEQGLNGGGQARRRPARQPSSSSGSKTAAEDDDAKAMQASVKSAKPSSKSRKRARDVCEEGSGVHVRYRPDMQKRARDGQEHWLTQVRKVRAEWMERDEGDKDEGYGEQVDMCAAQQIKSQHECILRCLQMSKTDGLIEALPFTKCGPDSFLGWTGFTVIPDKAQEFRKRIDQLFPAPLKENTLHTAFRRAGLVPEKWSSGWLGLTAFRFSNEKRVAYAPTPAAAAAATKPKKR